MNSVWIGFDPRPAEVMAFAVTRESVRRHTNRRVPIRGLVLSELRASGLYTRPTEVRPSAADRPILWDVISDAPMSTEFAISRFLVPYLARQTASAKFTGLDGVKRERQLPAGWALFMDGDMLVRSDLAHLGDRLDRTKAVYCVKHNHRPVSDTKMDGQTQLSYARKNWSSFLIFQCDHASNSVLTPSFVNTMTGRDLHRLCWLEDEEIGELGQEWNWLVGHSNPDIDPKVVHFTDGPPSMSGFENVPFAGEWRATLASWAS